MIVLGMVVWVLGTPLGFLPTLFYPIEWIADRYWGAGPLIENWSEVLCPLSYIVFLVHFKWTFYAENRRAFLLLMFSLVLLVSASLVGCSKEMRTIDLQH